MGGHGGLNILPQKRWNVYNYDNREKVKRDEEAAAKEEQLKREQARKRDAEFRLDVLRQSRGLATPAQAQAPSSSESEPKSKSNHINLFEGIKIFDPVGGVEGKGDDERWGFKKMKMVKKEAAPRVVTPEDEKYRLGYGIAGKGVKLPWYLARPSDDGNSDEVDFKYRVGKGGDKSGGKKTVEQLREERLKREKREKERERALMMEKGRRDGAALKNSGFSRR
ncbi:hypothetical protein Acr_15g0005590 [Actinidia rufa]|uniref:CBF1-interacting co-repressor CIR N-terminal domain-containing protein n=1 Tax=Actinidia rufa TaxID=165716 RepID=A0A7J0FUU4_9ERIC|nr:hypothetical protein Acr_15g0005590 [Actinidia rufa]